MRTIWKGAISFGLVTIPIKVYSAVEEKSLKFNQLHEKDMGRIKMKRTCSIDGEEIPYDQIVKGYEYEKDHYVVLTEEELDRGLPGTRAIDVLKFVNEDEIDPILWKSSYYIVPDAAGGKAYALLRSALGEGKLVALVKLSWRDKEHLATLRVKDRCFVLETMYWPDEIREPAFDELQDDPEVKDQEVQMAKMLIDSMTDVFKPDEFKDMYREKLEELVAKKIEGKEIALVEEEGAGGAVVDLMEALRASVEAASKKSESATG
ncbi:MAG: non-homologous end joining protein Ku [Actinomycetota bacterium]